MEWLQNGLRYGPVNLNNRMFESVQNIFLKIINFITKTMKNWNVELVAGGRALVEVKIQRSIFQGDSRSPIIFVIAMMPLNT